MRRGLTAVVSVVAACAGRPEAAAIVGPTPGERALEPLRR